MRKRLLLFVGVVSCSMVVVADSQSVNNMEQSSSLPAFETAKKVMMMKEQQRDNNNDSIRDTDNEAPSGDASLSSPLRSPRQLQETAIFDIQLFFELQFISDATAEAFETSNPTILDHFCRSVQAQATGTIVAEAAALELDATISIFPDGDYQGCRILNTSRSYDPEAENLFGPGHLAFQLQVSQTLSVTSEERMWAELVTFVTAKGFDISTGGQRQFRSLLLQDDSFDKVQLIELRRSLAPPDEQPTSAPSDTMQPTTGAPTALPTRWPTTGFPTFQPPTEAPSRSWSLSTSPSVAGDGGLSPPPFSAESQSPSFRQLVTENPTDSRATTVPIRLTDNNSTQGFTRVQPGLLVVIVIATITLVVCCIVLIYMLCRRKREKNQRQGNKTMALTLKDGQLVCVPGVVELDQESLAATTLGEYTAGRSPPKRRQGQAIHPLDSFDENSLYTTPFSMRNDGSNPSTSSHLPYSFQSNLIRPVDYHGSSILRPLSDSNTESSDGIYSAGQRSTGPVSVDAGPVDLDSESPFDDQFGNKKLLRPGPVDLDVDYNIVGILPDDLIHDATQASSLRRQSSARRQFESADMWSCDFEDFDRGSSYYDDSDVNSKATSLTSVSSKQVKQLASPALGDLTSPDYQSDASFDLMARRDSPSLFLDSKAPLSLQEQQERLVIEELGKPTISEDISESFVPALRKEIPPSPAYSKKSVVSKNSSTSGSSWGSQKVHTGMSTMAPLSVLGRMPADGSDDAKEESLFGSPFAKILSSAKATFSNHSRSIPVATPETAEESESDTESREQSLEAVSDLMGVHLIDDPAEEAISQSSASTENPWLMEAVEQALGPRSVTADMESLNGKSQSRTTRSRSGTVNGTETEVSFGSEFTGLGEEASLRPRTLEHDLRRLEIQLKALDKEGSDAMTTWSGGVSTITGTSFSTFRSRSSRPPKVSRRKRKIVLVPAGKLGVTLANQRDGKGTVISAVRDTSPLQGKLLRGDKLIAIDGEDVTGMEVSQITSLMASKAKEERRLTVVTSSSTRLDKKKPRDSSSVTR